MIPSFACVLFLAYKAVTTHGVKVHAVTVQPDAVNILQRDNASQEPPETELLGTKVQETCPLTNKCSRGSCFGGKCYESETGPIIQKTCHKSCNHGFCSDGKCYKGRNGKHGCKTDEDCEDACDKGTKTCIDCRDHTDCSTVELHMTEGGPRYNTLCLNASEANVAIEERQRSVTDDEGLRCRIPKLPKDYECGEAVTGRSRTGNNGGCKDGLKCSSDNTCHRVLDLHEDCEGNFESDCGWGLECRKEWVLIPDRLPREKVQLSRKCLGVTGGHCHFHKDCSGYDPLDDWLSDAFCCRMKDDNGDDDDQCQSTKKYPEVCVCRKDADCPNITSFCSTDVHQCRFKLDLGEECDRNKECESGHCRPNNTAEKDGSCRHPCREDCKQYPDGRCEQELLRGTFKDGVAWKTYSCDRELPYVLPFLRGGTKA